MVGLCDCNNFFVSCQRVFRPDLNKRPVAVMSGNDACIIARSNEVKALGIPMGSPLFKVRDIIKENDVVLFSANHKLYSDMSSRVMSVLRQSTPSIEVYSVDEAFIDYRGVEISTLKVSTEELARKVYKYTGIPVSIGIAPTKTLAKIASKLCKQYPRLNGSCLMSRSEDIEKVLKKIDIGEVWGIGRQTRLKLYAMGLNTAYDFYLLPHEKIKSKFNINVQRIHGELRGIPSVHPITADSENKSISITRTFNKEIKDLEALSSVFSKFARLMAEKLRKHSQFTTELSVQIFTNRFGDASKQYCNSSVVKLKEPTNNTLEMIRVVNDELKKIHRPTFGYKRVGIVCQGLVTSRYEQDSLFEHPSEEKNKALMKSIDDIKNKYGGGRVVVASEYSVKKEHKIQSLSKCYTTIWNDILTIKIN